MYAIYGNIYHQYTPNVSIYIPYMDPMGVTSFSPMFAHGFVAVKKGYQVTWFRIQRFHFQWPFKDLGHQILTQAQISRYLYQL